MDLAELSRTIITCYEEEAVAYRGLLALAGRVRECLEAGELSRLEELLREQGRLTAVIDRCGETALPLRRQLGAAYGHPDLTLGILSAMKDVPAALRPVGDAMRVVAGLLQELAALHDVNQRLLAERLKAVRSEQVSLTRTKTAVRAYLGTNPEDSRFVDRRS